MVALIKAILVCLLTIAKCDWACQNTTWSSSQAFMYPANETFELPKSFNCSYTITASNGTVALLKLLAKMITGDMLYISFGNGSRYVLPNNTTFTLSIPPPSAILTVVTESNSTNSHLRASINWRSYSENASPQTKTFGSTQYGELFNISASVDTTLVLSAENKVAIHAFPVERTSSLVSILLYDGNINDQSRELKFLGTLYEAYMNQKPIISEGPVMTIKCFSPENASYFYAQDSAALTGFSEIKTYISPAVTGSIRELDFNGLNGSAVAMVLNTIPKQDYYMTSYNLVSKPDDNSALLKVFPVFPSSKVNLDSLSLKAYINNSINGKEENTELPQAFMGRLRCFTISNGSAHIELGGQVSKDLWQMVGNNRVGILDIEGLANEEKKEWDFHSNSEKIIVLSVNCENDKEIAVGLVHDGTTTTLNNTVPTETIMTNFSITAQMKNVSALGCNVMFSAYDNGHSSTFQVLIVIFPAMIYIFNQYIVT